MMDRIEHGPKQVAFKLEGAHRVALQLWRVAMVQRNRERFTRVASRLGDSTTEVIKTLRIDPGIKFFERSEACRHQIGREKLRKR